MYKAHKWSRAFRPARDIQVELVQMPMWRGLDVRDVGENVHVDEVCWVVGSKLDVVILDMMAFASYWLREFPQLLSRAATNEWQVMTIR